MSVDKSIDLRLDYRRLEHNRFCCILLNSVLRKASNQYEKRFKHLGNLLNFLQNHLRRGNA